MPYLIRGFAMYSEIFGFFCPRKKPKNKNGTMYINSE
tara:strand:+ start:565 stop:675 length:111 start_codon:yes stop_codon:yes gene_type:complete